MGIFDSLLDVLKNSNNSLSDSLKSGVMPYGENKSDGSHDHRYNKGEDRTPAQKTGDKKRLRTEKA